MRCVLLLSLLLLKWTPSCNTLYGAPFEAELNKFAREAIGVRDMQDFYDELTYTTTSFSGQNLVATMASSLETTFGRLTEAVEAIKAAVENNYQNFGQTSSLPHCCTVTGTADSKFRVEVNFTTACISESSDTPTEKRIPTAKIQEVLKENYNRNPDLLWQYFGGEDGSFITYPAQKFSTNCYNYDPRYRPYYTATASAMHKDVVIVMDTSKSMSTQENNRARIILARDAAQTVVDTLNPSDRFGLVAFSSSVKTPGVAPGECYDNELSVPSSTNKKNIKEFINRLEPGGDTYYIMALQKAFDFFENSEYSINGEKRDQVILFMTDGDQSDTEDPLDVIKVRNGQLGNRVMILTYALGRDISGNGIQKLEDMARQTKNNDTFGEVQIGKLQIVEDPNNLRSVMAKYYTYFSTGSSGGPTFTIPYFDLLSEKTGLITSLCLPVYDRGSLIGVACTDIILSQLLSDFTYFKQGELSYAFIIDGQGHVLVHYLQPIPTAFTSDPDPTYIENLERSPDARSVIESMKGGGKGNKTFLSQRTIPNGALLYEGIQTRSVLSQYSWEPVTGSNYSLCIVLGEGDKQATLSIQDKLTTQEGVKFVYHRRDLYPLNYRNCKQYSRFATKDKSMVMLTPHAFTDPYKYLHTKETPADAKKYTDYFGGSQINPGLKSTILADVYATYHAELIWKEKQSVSDYVVWRYLGTLEGVVRVYPAVQITQDYDHYHRAWWKRTNALKGINVVITPYIDLWGAGMVVTQCHSLYQGRKSGQHSTNDTVDAAMCIDFPFLYFNRKFLELYPECVKNFSCMVVDVSGFLVVHPHFTEVTDSPKIDGIHLGTKDGAIMEDLISKGAMIRNSCADFESNKDQYTYRIIQTHKISFSETNQQYEFVPVGGSNIFIIKKSKNVAEATVCCNSGGTSPNVYGCSEESDCCLCNTKISYEVCPNKHNSEDSSPTCSARVPDSNSLSPNDTLKIQTLEPCFDPQCHTKKTEDKCFDVAGCSWCTEYSDKTLIDNPSCNVLDICPFGRVAAGKKLYTPPSTGPPQTGKSDSNTIIIVCVVAAAVVIVAVIVAIVVLRLRTRQNKEDIDPYLNVVHRPDEDQPPPPYGQTVNYHAYERDSSDGKVEIWEGGEIPTITEQEEQRYV